MNLYRRIKLLALLYVAFEFLDPSGGLIRSNSAAAQVAIGYPCNQFAIPATCADFSALTAAINAIITPLVPTVTGSVNSISLTPAVTGGVATISPGATSDANAAIGLSPRGNGNIILFQGDMRGLGVLQFGNLASFVSAPSTVPFPGPVPGQAAMQGVHNTLQGVLLFKDWLGFTRGIPAY